MVGFGPELIRVVLNCLSSTRLSVIWNGDRLAHFKPERGLRQGDPLSPYLFVLCMETLHHKIARAVAGHRWKPCKANRRGPPVAHLFFADDMLLFGEASVTQAEVMENILNEFCSSLGQ